MAPVVALQGNSKGASHAHDQHSESYKLHERAAFTFNSVTMPDASTLSMPLPHPAVVLVADLRQAHYRIPCKAVAREACITEHFTMLRTLS